MGVVMPSCFILLLSTLCCFGCWKHVEGGVAVAKTIVVDLNGRGNFKSIQAAIDSIPANNSQWIRIKVNSGIYMEKVTIPMDKPFILLEGSGNSHTIIDWGASATTESSATFRVDASDFVAKAIGFKNGYNCHGHSSHPIKQAVAALIYGDKLSFYDCSFIGFQDTLFDDSGRHYFKNCYIEGAIDFISGYGQSIYESCRLNVVVNSSLACGYLTAQGRLQPTDSNGFVFKYCNITGTGKVYLGRAWGPFARVLFYQTFMSDVVIPVGWDAWVAKEHVDTITFAENGCTGPGSNLSGRVTWEKSLTKAELDQLTSMSFINSDGWIEQQP
ncbi:putative pectinesterase 66 [Tasmannia lanceolata]|uniref:putative pectinesterase 66 n=1 Tax=Tasmannia lanceolata TaxID=3420 RepID=UPI00406360BD